MSKRCKFACSAIREIEVELLRAVHWRVYGSLGLETASNFVYNMYADTRHDAARVVAGSSLSVLAQDDEDWNLSDVPLSRNVDVCASLCVDFTAF